MKHKKKSKRSWRNDKDSSSNSQSDTESDLDGETELDLADYAGDCIKLMSEAFKVLGDKKLKKMIPTVLKPVSIDDLKACLVEECMALSKKRIISVINGEIYSSSSETDEDLPKMSSIKKEVDIISLESISDDSDIICFEDEKLPILEPLKINKENRKKRQISDSLKISRKKHKKKIKAEVSDMDKKRIKKKNDTEPVIEEKAMTALELLELQARARAIKSQLMLETAKSNTDEDVVMVKKEDDDYLTNNITEQNSSDKTDFGPSTSVSIQDVAENSKPKKVKLRRDHLVSGASIIQASKSKTVENIQQISNFGTEEIMIKNSRISEHKNVNEIASVSSTLNTSQRRGSSDSLIMESPSHPLIILSSEDEANNSVCLEKCNSKRVDTKTHSTKCKGQSDNEVDSNSNHQTENGKKLEQIEISKEDFLKTDTQKPEEIIDKDTPTEEKEINNDKQCDSNECTAEIIHNKDSERTNNTLETEELIVTNKSSSAAQESTENLSESVDLDCIIIDSEPDFESESEMLNESSGKLENEDNLANNENLTWKTRWLGSKRVQNVLQTSKIYNSMKRKLTSRKDRPIKPVEPNEESTLKINQKNSNEYEKDDMNNSSKSNVESTNDERQ